MDEEGINAQTDYLYSLDEESLFLLEKWTTGAFDLVNSYLRKTNTMNVYKENIKRNNIVYNIDKLPIFFYELEKNIPTLIGDNLKPTKNKSRKNKKRNLNGAKRNTYRSKYRNLYPTLQKKLNKNTGDITYFRNLMKIVSEKLYKIIVSAPRAKTPFTVYRGTDKNSLPEYESITTRNNFSSTTLNIRKASSWGEKMLILNVDPAASYLYVKPISVTPNEDEILLGPGNQFQFVSKDGNKITYNVLPPKEDYVFSP
jgi:hypothetical protein